MTTFSTALKLELPGDGQQSGTWGQTTNKNLGTLLEQAITGVQTITMLDANYTLTNLNGVSDEARNAVLVVGGTNSAVRNVIVPSVNKLYTVKNNTAGGYAIVIKTSGGTGFTVQNGQSINVYCDGTDMYAQQTMAPTPPAGDSSQAIATTSFVNSYLPVGMIVMWSGSVASIPSGWHLCDGGSGTPNLRDRFIIGAGTSYNPGDTGGSTSITTSNMPSHTHYVNISSGGESSSHYHYVAGYTGGQNADHSHYYTHVQGGGGVNFNGGGWADLSGGAYTGGTSNDHAHYFSANTGEESSSHYHGVNGYTDATGSGSAFLPPYYALCFIMKV